MEEMLKSKSNDCMIFEFINKSDDSSLKSFSIYDKRIKFDDILKKECDQIIVEFAIYKKVDLLTSMNAYYLDEIRFNEQALSYEIFSILIDL